MRCAKWHCCWDRAPDWDSGNLGVYHSSAIAFFALVCFGVPSSHLFVCFSEQCTQPSAHNLPERFGDVPPLTVPDFSSSPNPAHEMIVTPSSTLTQRQLPFFLLPSADGCAPGPVRAGTALTSPTGPLQPSRVTRVQS